MELKVSMPLPRTLTRILLVFVASLIVASTAGQVVRFTLGYEHLKGLVPLFYVDLESNLPTWYSSCALLLAAVLLAVVARAKWQQGDGSAGIGRCSPRFSRCCQWTR